MDSNANQVNQNKPAGSSLSAAEYMAFVNAFNFLQIASNNGGLSIGADSKNDEGQTLGYYLDGTNYVGGPEQLALGPGAKTYGYRGMAVGNKSIAGATSATAVGSGAIARSVHDVVLGRGSMSGVHGVTAPLVLGSNGVLDLHIGMSWAHRMPNMPESGISIGSYADYVDIVNRETVFRGVDAFDARGRAWTAGLTFQAGELCVFNGNRYVGNGGANIGNNPESSTRWSLMGTATDGAASDFNKDGGNSAIAVGLGTGSGKGGEIRFKIARPVSGTAENNQLPFVNGGYFDSNAVAEGESNFVLSIRNNPGTQFEMKRVVEDANGFLKVVAA